MQGEKEMKEKVSTPTEWKVSTPTLSWKGGGHRYWLTYWQTDQAAKIQEFQMLYGTKKG